MSIFNPVLFLGEQSLGTVAGAPLSTDSNNQLISGITSGKVSNSTTVTAATGTDVLITGMTVTPVAGTYNVWFSTDVNSSTAGAVISLAFYVGGTIVTDGQIKFMPFTGGTLTTGAQRIGISLNDQVVVNGSQAIEIRWSTSSGSPTAAAKRLTYSRVI